MQALALALPAGEQVHTQPRQLPAELVRARQLRTVGTQASAAVLGLGLIAALSQGLETPSLPQWSFTGLACLVAVGAVVLGLAVTKDKAQLELHEGRLYIQWGAPSRGPPLAERAIEVQSLQASLRFAVNSCLKCKSQNPPVADLPTCVGLMHDMFLC